MKKNILYIMLAVTFSACDDDSNGNQQQVLDDSMLVGEWVSSNSSNTYYTDIEMLSSQKANYSVYANTVGNNPAFIEDKGNWSWYSTRQMLSFYLVHEKTPFSEVVEIDNNKLVLRNASYNTIDTFYRVVETINLEVGQTVAIKYEHQGTVMSSNSEIAIIDSEGLVEAVQGGIAFIRINTDDNVVYAKVVVKGRSDRFKEEIHLLADDIKAKYGEPGYEGLQSNGQMAMQYLYPLTGDPALYGLQYWYHKDTHQIRLIQSIYSSEEAFQRDKQYITNKLILQDVEPYNLYGEYENYWNNSYLATVVGLSGSLYWINYTNLDYE